MNVWSDIVLRELIIINNDLRTGKYFNNPNNFPMYNNESKNYVSDDEEIPDLVDSSCFEMNNNKSEQIVEDKKSKEYKE